MHEKAHVLNILESAKEAIKKEDVILLKELSNQTVHTASTIQDTDSILIAIIIYSLSKIIERKHQYDEKLCRDFCKFSIIELDKAIKSLKQDDERGFNSSLERIMNSVNKFSSDFKRNVQDVLNKARINKASKIYEHGISMEQTANLLGISQYELAGYVGLREDRTAPLMKTESASERIKLAMRFFG